MNEAQYALDTDESIEAAIDKYADMVFRLALVRTRNRHDADDVCQEVFLRVYRFLGSFKEISNFSTWIYRITINACKDSVTRPSVKMETPADLQAAETPHLSELPDIRYNPEDAFEKKNMRELIARGILQLSPECRDVLIMRDIDGMTYGEIARTLSLELGTVKSRIARARESLRDFLCENGNFCAKNQSKK